jgi:hypothetical protein
LWSPVREEWLFSSLSSVLDDSPPNRLAQKHRTGSSTTCKEPNAADQSLVLTTPSNSGASWHRSVYANDGATDIVIEKSSPSGINNSSSPPCPEFVTLRLRAPIDTSILVPRDDGSNNPSHQVYWLQNNESRITLLLSEPIILSHYLLEPGRIDIPISSSSLLSSSKLRLRLIVEDVDTFHQGAKERENYFGKFIADYFFHPFGDHRSHELHFLQPAKGPKVVTRHTRQTFNNT